MTTMAPVWGHPPYCYYAQPVYFIPVVRPVKRPAAPLPPVPVVGSEAAVRETVREAKRVRVEDLDAAICLLNLRKTVTTEPEGKAEEPQPQPQPERRLPPADVDESKIDTSTGYGREISRLGFPNYGQFRLELYRKNTTLYERVRSQPGRVWRCKSTEKGNVCHQHIPCRTCLCEQGIVDLKDLLRATEQGNNTFASWQELCAFCEKAPQGEMLQIVADILKALKDEAKEGVRLFANHAVKLIGTQTAVVSDGGWAQHALNLGVIQIFRAINELIDDATFRKFAIGTHISQETCARIVLLYFFLNKCSTNRNSKRKDISERKDRRPYILYDEYRNTISVPRPWEPMELLVKFKIGK